MKNFAPAKVSLGFHWHNYDTNILPPIIETKLQRESYCKDISFNKGANNQTVNSKTEQSTILVYLPFENQQQVADLLQQFPQTQFIQYAPDLIDKTVNNIQQRKTALSFKQDLTRASGVICNSGFELISECIHLGLPILTKPLQGQMEQHSNALALKQLHLATVTEQLSLNTINHWLSNKPAPSPKPIPNVAKAVAQLIVAGKWREPSSINEQLWQEFDS